MKLKLLFLLYITVAFGSACKKDKTPEEKTSPIKLLSKVTRTNEDGEKIVTLYTYDEKNRLKTIKESYGTFNYVYNSDFLFEIESSGTSQGKVQMTYTNGRPTRALRKLADKSRIYGYIYSEDKVTEIHANENGLVVNIDKITYQDGNIIKKVSDYGQGVVTEECTYGNKKSRFINVRLKYVLGVESFDRYSVNELLESKVSFDNGALRQTNNSYTYDSDDYPITMTSSLIVDNVKAPQSKYVFEYIVAN